LSEIVEQHLVLAEEVVIAVGAKDKDGGSGGGAAQQGGGAVLAVALPEASQLAAARMAVPRVLRGYRHWRGGFAVREECRAP
jgi:hypothetical protein